MAKRKYMSPVLMGLASDDEVIIDFGGSQGTSGYDSPYTFSGIADDILAMIEANCDDTELSAMDVNKDLVITSDEFDAWYNSFDDDDKPW